MIKVNPRKVPAIVRAYKQLDKEADKQIEIIYGSATIALHRYWGWKLDQITHLIDVAGEEWSRVASDITINPISEFEAVSGIELKADPNGKGWRELGFLNHDVNVGTRDYITIPQMLAQISQQKKWLPTVIVAIILMCAYKECGFCVDDLAELMNHIDYIRHQLNMDRTLIKKECYRETGIKINGLRYFIEEFNIERG